MSTSQGRAVIVGLRTGPVLPRAVCTNAGRPPAPSTSAGVSGFRAPSLVSSGTHVVASSPTSGAALPPAAARRRTSAVPSSSRVARTVMFGCSRWKAATSRSMAAPGCVPSVRYQKLMVTAGRSRP